jgi:membrane protease YdiL (CAAX protease family)
MNKEHLAPAGARRITIVVIVLCLLSFVLHSLGLTLVEESFARSFLPDAFERDLDRMSASTRYAESVDSAASFLFATWLQIMISCALTLTLIARRVLVWLTLLPKRELEGGLILSVVLLLLLLTLSSTYVEETSVFFNESPRLGKESFFLRRLYVSIPLFFLLPSLLACLFCPAAVNLSIKMAKQHRNGEVDDN